MPFQSEVAPPRARVRPLVLVVVALAMLVPLALAVLFPLSSPLEDYLVLHITMEGFSVIVASLIFTIAWHTAGPARSPAAALLGAGANIKEAVQYANRAGGIVVGKLGTAVVTHAELFN